MMKKTHNQHQTEERDQLSQRDIRDGIKPFAQQDEAHKALENPEGKNNGAKPDAYQQQQSHHP